MPELVFSGSSDEYEPYIGFPSYAHPMIPESSEPSSWKDVLNVSK